MNLEQLRSFATLAEVGHFTQAAGQLHLAQPSLSRQIATLEQDLGAELFHRARGNITLTAAGQALLPLATRMLADADRVRREMAELAGLRKGTVRFGAPPSLCMSLLTEVLHDFHNQYPGIELQLREAGSKTLLEELTAGVLDMALIVSSEHGIADGSLVDIPLLREELVVISDLARSLPGRNGRLTLGELAPLPQIALSTSYDLRSATAQAYNARGLTPHIVLEGVEMDAVLGFVESKLGLAIVPATVAINRPQLRTLRLSEPQMTRTLSLAHRRDVSLSPAAAAMATTIRRSALRMAQENDGLISLDEAAPEAGA